MERFAKLAFSVIQTQRGFAPTCKPRNFEHHLKPLGTYAFSSQVSSDIDLQGCTTKEISIKKQNSLSSQRPSSHQRLTRRKSIHRSTQDSRHGISPKAMDLVDKVLVSLDIKEQVCKELDKWVTSEGKFSIAYVKQAIQVFEREKHWSRIIQVTEWMLQKGEGETLRTYEVLLKALDMHGCIDEAEAVWKNNILKKSWSIPTRLVASVLAMYERHHKPLEVIKLFKKMEDDGRNMDGKSVRKAARAYEEEGFLEMKKQILLKYKLPLKDRETVEDSEAS